MRRTGGGHAGRVPHAQRACTDGRPIDPVLAPYRKLEEDNSYYICGMAVLPEYRGNGIGTRFLQIAEEQAMTLARMKNSLVVFEDNAGAKRLYERSGYVEVARERIVAHPLIRAHGDALLMVKRLQDSSASA